MSLLAFSFDLSICTNHFVIIFMIINTVFQFFSITKHFPEIHIQLKFTYSFHLMI